MENRSLVDLQGRLDFFQQSILINLRYWHTWLEPNLADVAAVDQERDKIVDAILFALDVGQPAWSAVYPLITTFSPHMERRGDWDRWALILERATEVADQDGDRSGMVNLLVIAARLRSRQSQKAAVVIYRRTIRLARQLGDLFSEARACTNLGYLYIEQGYWFRAETLCLHALKIFEQIENDHGKAHTENHLGVLYTRQRQWDQARYCLEQACVIWRRTGDAYGLMHGYNNLGRLFNEMEDFEKAITCLKKAIHHAKQTGTEALIGTLYMNLGIAHRSLGNSTDAANYYHQAKIIFEQFSNTLDWAKLHDNLGLLYMDQRKWAEAEIYFKQALKTWQALDNQFYEIQTMIFLAEFEMARDHNKQAGDWLNETQNLLEASSETKQYRQLQARVKKIRHSLTERNAQQTMASQIDLQHSAN